MAAQLLGTTGNWGIPTDQSGILITDLSFDFSNQEKPVLDKGGEIIGLSLYQEKVEIKLYAGVPTKPELFDKPGIAVLGCNIHDRMAAWVVVADTPWHAMSGSDGVARIADAPPGAYQLSVWHAGLAADSAPVTRKVQLAGSELRESFQLPLEAQP